MSVLGTNVKNPFYNLFMDSKNQLNHPKTGGYSPLHSILTITVLLEFKVLNGVTAPLSLSLSVIVDSRCRTYLHGIGILTDFPFGIDN